MLDTALLPDNSVVLLHLFTFLLASLAGLAAIIRIQRKFTILSIFSAMLNSGLLGLSLSLIGYKYFKDNIEILVGGTIIIGLGGTAALETVINIVIEVARSTFTKLDNKSKDDDK